MSADLNGYERLIEAIEQHTDRAGRPNGKEMRLLCPVHDDRNPSLDIAEAEDGSPLVICRSCGAKLPEVAAALGRPMSDFLTAREAPAALPARRKGVETPPAPLPSSAELERYRLALVEAPSELARLEGLRGWTPKAIERLGLGLDGDRIIFAIRDRAGVLVNVLRYLPDPATRGDAAKMISLKGRPRELWPSPETIAEGEESLWLMEGEADAVRATSIGLNAVGLPGTAAWRKEWAQRFAGRRVVICLDCDKPGREAAKHVLHDLTGVAAEVRVVDLDATRTDGYDLSDFSVAAKTAAERAQARDRLEQMAEDVPCVEPPSPADGALLLDDVFAFVRRYVVLGEHETGAVTLWIAHTHALDAAEATPYLSVTSAEIESGKTHLLAVVALLVHDPLKTVNISDASLFRVIEMRCPTVLMDEVDAVFGPKARDREDLRGLLNSGYTRGEFAYRMGGANMTELQSFETFSPKALAGLGELPDTLASRSIPIRMKRRIADELVERFRLRDAKTIAGPLKTRLASWAASALPSLRDARPELPDELGDRAQDVWEPLLAIADLAGGDWPRRARADAIALTTRGNPDDSGVSFGVRLLADCRSAFERREVDRLTTADLIAALAEDEAAPWATLNGGAAIKPHRLATLLKPYGIRPNTIRLDSHATLKGYQRDDFADAWRRLLPARAVTPSQPASEAGSGGLAIRHRAVTEPSHDETDSDRVTDTLRLVTDEQTGANPHGSLDVTDVTDRTPKIGDPGYRDHLNVAFDAGQITEGERRKLRRLHSLVAGKAGGAKGERA